MSKRLDKERLYMFTRYYVNVYENNKLKDCFNLLNDEKIDIIESILFFLGTVINEAKVMYDTNKFLILIKDENKANNFFKHYGNKKIFLYPREIKITRKLLKQKQSLVIF